jgi:hypothetical protein
LGASWPPLGAAGAVEAGVVDVLAGAAGAAGGFAGAAGALGAAAPDCCAWAALSWSSSVGAPAGLLLPGAVVVPGAGAAGLAALSRMFVVVLSAPLSSVSPSAMAKNSAARMPVTRVSIFAVPRTVMKPPAPPPPMPRPPPSERCSRITTTSATTISR